ncbi:aminotransferase class I/II-fold pyridoxal phosphate-dependent enzyme [Ruegeria arenilitoris]|uniref:aminotransferase class I/II-fold pyridoxal phosphate-dependent enzyme n=1 Tax=Ruegeria arenilitoris TaxID=1173585 RepID=UPI00147B6EF5
MQRLGFREWLAAGTAIARGDLLRNSGSGQYCRRFERRLSELTGAKQTLMVNSGTSALTVALASLGVGPGDEVLVPAYTWMASAAAVVHVGAVPILVEIDETLAIDPKDIENKISHYTRAILPVHMSNRPCNMDSILKTAKKHGLLVVEDACQAVGIKYRGQHCGAIGDAGAFSFNQHKNITIGESGAVLLSSDHDYFRAFNYHDIGISYRNDAFAEPSPLFIGLNLRANEISGAMMNTQLSTLHRVISRMKRRYEVVTEALEKGRFPLAPQNDPDNALGVVVTFDTEKEAEAFAERRGVSRVFDSTKHVYSNWDPILEKRTFHPKVDPWAWAQRPIEYAPDMCPRTLDILRRSCRVGIGERYPLALVRMVARDFSKG